MKKNISITRLAEYCGCSPSTVSRVFNGTMPVSTAMRNKILSAAERFNYPRGLKIRKNTVALIVSDNQQWTPPSWYACNFISVLLGALSASGYKVILCRISDAAGLDVREIIAGVILDWSSPVSAIKSLQKLGIPLICINTFIGGVNTVCADHAGQMAAAVRYLLRAGHRKIIYLEPSSDNWGSSERLRGARIAFADTGIVYKDNFTTVWNSEMMLEKELFKRMLMERTPSAIITLHEDWSIDVYRILVSLGFTVGKDISLITSEIGDTMGAFEPGITTIRQDIDGLANGVVEMIKNQRSSSPFMNGIMHYVIPCIITERNSVKKLNTSGKEKI